VNNIKDSTSFLSTTSFLGCCFLWCLSANVIFAQNVTILENTVIVAREALQEQDEPQSQTSFSQDQPIVYVIENTIVTGFDHYEVQIQKTPTRKQTWLVIAQPKVPIVTQKETHPHLFSKTPYPNQYSLQTSEAVATIVTLTSKNPVKKILLKHNYSNFVITINQEHNIFSFDGDCLLPQNSITYTLMGYLPPPS